MSKLPGLTRRGDVFYFRKRVPEDIRKLILGDFRRWKLLALNPGSNFAEWQSLAPARNQMRPFFERSLKTGDRRSAEVEFHDLSTRLADAYQGLRVAFVERYRNPSDNDVRRLAQRYFSEQETLAESDLAGSGLRSVQLNEARQNLIEDLVSLNRDDPIIVGRLHQQAERLLSSAQFECEERSIG